MATPKVKCKQTRPLKRWQLTYAYDMPYYVDFTVEATSFHAALRHAEKALRAGRFENVIGQSDYSVSGDRVFGLGPAPVAPNNYTSYSSMDELIEEANS